VEWQWVSFRKEIDAAEYNPHMVYMTRPCASVPYELVLIEWVDASRLSDGWIDLSAIPDPYPHKCVTVGFRVAAAFFAIA
jgi:hypothetical protein